MLQGISRPSLTPPPLPSRNLRRTPSPSSNENEKVAPRSVGQVVKEDLEICDTLGEGEFGCVYRGTLRQSDGSWVRQQLIKNFDQKNNECFFYRCQ